MHIIAHRSGPRIYTEQKYLWQEKTDCILKNNVTDLQDKGNIKVRKKFYFTSSALCVLLGYMFTPSGYRVLSLHCVNAAYPRRYSAKL